MASTEPTPSIASPAATAAMPPIASQMLRVSWRRALSAAIAAVVLPVSADAQTAPAGDALLRIEHCAVSSRSQLLDPLNSLRIDFVSGLNVRFSNLRSTTAIAVRFTFAYQGDTVSLTDRGTFAPGLAIERAYPTFAGQVSGGTVAKCSVSQITYDDGTTWLARQ